MIKPGALVMAVLMTGVTAGTYYGLELLPPGMLPEPLGRSAAKDAHAAPAPAAPTQTASAGAAAPPPPPAPAAEEPVTEQDLAEEPPPKESAPVATAAAEPEPAPEPAAAPPPAEDTPPALREPEADAAPKPKAAARKPAPAPEAAPAAEAAPTDSANAAPVKAKPPESDVIKPWWPDPAKMPAEQLKLQYAGQVQGEQAIALLFSAPLKVDTLKQYARINSAGGEAVSGQWELGKNPRLAIFRGVQPGRYTVVLQPQIADEKGFMLGTTLKGPVYIQAQ
jgi:hypothetical protein